MVKMEPIIKEWYDQLAEGKIMGLKCDKCGSIEFPPVPVCNTCGNMSLHWAEMSGKGRMVSFSFSPMGIAPYSTEDVVSGYCILEEGMYFTAPIIDFDPDDMDALLERLKKGPIPIHLEVTKMDDKYSYPFIHMEETI